MYAPPVSNLTVVHSPLAAGYRSIASDSMPARATKAIAVAILGACWAVAAGGCVTIGYDFLKQQATVTFDAKAVKEPSK